MSRQTATAYIKKMKYVIVEHLMNHPNMLRQTLGNIREQLWENAMIQQHYIKPLNGKIGQAETRNQFANIVDNSVMEMGGCAENGSDLPIEINVLAATQDGAVEAAASQHGFRIKSCSVEHMGADQWLVSNIEWDESCPYDEEDCFVEDDEDVCPVCKKRNCSCDEESEFVAPPLY